jgi:glucose/arabinose dehydrogenase
MLRANCTRSGILRAAVVLVGVLGWCAGGAVPRTQAAPPVDFTNELVAGGLSLPTSIIFLPDGRMLIAEKGGTILIADPASTPATPSAYMTISDIATDGEQGLLDITLDPDFLSNGWFYVYYAHASSQRFRIARFDHLGATGDLASETLIWEDTSPFTGICCHHGGSINFGPDGKLYLTTGDEFDNFSAQSLSSTAGKVLRMNPDGSVPADNPFVDGPGGNDDHIWSYGFRNAFSGPLGFAHRAVLHRGRWAATTRKWRGRTSTWGLPARITAGRFARDFAPIPRSPIRFMRTPIWAWGHR